MLIHKFEGITFELVPECESMPMNIIIDNETGLIVQLPKTGAFYSTPLIDTIDTRMNVVMFKMDITTNTPPEINFHLSSESLECLKKISLLPFLSNGFCYR